MNKKEARLRRAKKNRAKISKQKNIRLSVHRSNNHIYAQLISADGTKVLTQSSSLNIDLREEKSDKNSKEKSKSKDKSAKVSNIQIAAKVGHDIAEKAKKAGIKNVAFDRSGYKYHGRVKALADAAKSNGLIF